jgi:hypothetical protein
MKQVHGQRPPKARRDQIIVRELPEEVLVYDLARDQAHCLNHSAVAIWNRCDGQTAPAAIAKALAKEIGSPLDERLVWLALAQLSRYHLLKEKLEWPVSVPRLSRREAVRLIALGAAMTLPLIVTITAPTPAQAATCLGRCLPCGTGAECCSGVCSTNLSGCASSSSRCA